MDESRRHFPRKAFSVSAVRLAKLTVCFFGGAWFQRGNVLLEFQSLHMPCVDILEGVVNAIHWDMHHVFSLE